jgi:hypothetical protein
MATWSIRSFGVEGRDAAVCAAEGRTGAGFSVAFVRRGGVASGVAFRRRSGLRQFTKRSSICGGSLEFQCAGFQSGREPRVAAAGFDAFGFYDGGGGSSTGVDYGAALR